MHCYRPEGNGIITANIYIPTLTTSTCEHQMLGKPRDIRYG